MSGRSLIPDLPLHGDMADKAERIFRRLRVPDIFGNPTYGEVSGPWVTELVRAIFGSFDPQTRMRAIREIFVLVPKKNGKSAIAAGIMMTAMILNDRPSAEAVLVAPTKEISSISFRQAAGIIRLDAQLARLFHIQTHLKRITNLRTLAELQIKAADADVITGSKATYVLIDETHVFAERASAEDVFVELRGGMASHPDGFLMQITSQSKRPPAGVFRAELKRARDVRDGKMDLPILPVLYELPIAAVVDGGWKDEQLWPLVNPHLNRSVDAQFLRDEVTKAEQDGPDKLALIASQHFNVEIGLGLHADRWPGADYWQDAALPGMTLDDLIARSEVCVAGIDGGGLDDLMALAVIGRDRETKAWLHWARAWAQPDVMAKRKSIVPALRDFAATGDLVFTGAPRQDEAEIVEICAKLKAAGVLPDEGAIGMDAHGVATLVSALESAGLCQPQVTAVGQGWKLQAAVLTLPRKLKDGSFRHAGQPMMAWSVGNARTELKGNNYVVTKQTAGAAKIDALMATFDAAILMLANPPAPHRANPRVRTL